MNLFAVRTVSETDDHHLIEGLGYPFGGPFNGSDTYGTRFSARTNFYWDLIPDGLAGAARFVRPVTYHHGMDSDVGLTRVGGYSPIRTDAKGVWVQAQLDKHHEYYDAIRKLLGEDALGFSGESAEHAVRIARDGEVLDWPAWPMALTPIPSNPWAVVASRSAETLRVVEVLTAAAKGEPPAEPIAARVATFSELVASNELAEELPEAFDTLRSAIYQALWATDADFNPLPQEAKTAAIQTSLDQFRDYVLGLVGDADAARSAFRAGARNSSSDQTRIDSIHEHSVALGASAHATDSSSGSADSDAEGAARSASDISPALRITVSQTAPMDEAALRAHAEQVGIDVARRIVGR